MLYSLAETPFHHRLLRLKEAVLPPSGLVTSSSIPSTRCEVSEALMHSQTKILHVHMLQREARPPTPARTLDIAIRTQVAAWIRKPRTAMILSIRRYLHAPFLKNVKQYREAFLRIHSFQTGADNPVSVKALQHPFLLGILVPARPVALALHRATWKS